MSTGIPKSIDNTAALDTPRATRREWIGLAVIALPCLLYSMDLTVLNLAVPHLSADLRPSSSELLWIVDIYGFLVAGSLITMGTLGGIAILGSIGTAVYRLHVANAVPDGVPPEAAAAARATLGGAAAVAGRLPDHVGAELEVARQAFRQAGQGPR